ncbi:MAG TPA: glycine zipper 2TM domain-containing protein [Klebsiella sp.]|jgi:outer membrane lipoprotein SlyB
MKCFFVFMGALLLVGCSGNPVGSADNVNVALTGQPMAVTQGTITSVRNITIQNESDNIAGAAAGGVLGGVTGSAIGGGSGRRIATAGGAVAGALTGQAIQRNRAQINGVELFIRPENGNEFVIVQPIGETPFFVGQRVNIASLRGQVTITPVTQL